MEIEVSVNALKKGKEIDITPKSASRAFKISIRYNELYQRFEVFRHYYRTRKNEVEYHSRSIKEVADYMRSMYGVELKIQNPNDSTKNQEA